MNNSNVARVIAYFRVSTSEQGDKGVGLAAQRQATERETTHRGWATVAAIEDVASGKSMRRVGLERALAMLKAGEADALLCSKLDRLTRDVGDFAELLKLSQRQGWAVILLDLQVDTSTSMGEAAAFMFAAIAQAERKRIGERTREGLAIKRAEGVRCGRPRTISPTVVRRIKRLSKNGKGLTEIARRLNVDNVPTAQGGKQWYPSTVRAVLGQV